MPTNTCNCNVAFQYKLTVQAEIRYFRFVYGLLLLSKQIITSDIRRVRIFGFLVESLTPSPLCMRTPIPIWVDGLYGLKAEQVLPGRISLSEQGLFAELDVVISL